MEEFYVFRHIRAKQATATVFTKQGAQSKMDRLAAAGLLDQWIVYKLVPVSLVETSVITVKKELP